MKADPLIIWFRQDLRLAFNPAFLHAVKEQSRIIAVYVWSPEEEGEWKVGAASRWWLHHSLKALEADLGKRGIQLFIQRGKAAAVLKKIVKQTGAKQVVWNIRYEPNALMQEKSVKQALEKSGCLTTSFHGGLLFAPGRILTKEGNPYQVFTPFYRACLREQIEPLKGKVPAKVSSFRGKIDHLEIDDLNLLPKIRWDEGFYEMWRPGERGAQTALQRFVNKGLSKYSSARDIPSRDGTSLLSAHLHFGEISPFQLWDALSHQRGTEPYLRQIIWREFAYQLLIHFPKTPKMALKAKFNDFPWRRSSRLLCAWQRGMTGYPIIDAGMRQLWKLGWMHNRVRMIAASFLVKDLMVPWQEGAKWFWDTLVDADLANNTLGWQWCAGCGADAAPYFRIFNPETQSKRFDPTGEYIRTFVPELQGLSDRWIHAPSLAPDDVLQKAGVVLGRTYPLPIVDHDAARKNALQAYHSWA